MWVFLFDSRRHYPSLDLLPLIAGNGENSIIIICLSRFTNQLANLAIRFSFLFSEEMIGER